MLTTLFHSVIYWKRWFRENRYMRKTAQPNDSFRAILSERIPHKFVDHLRGLNFGWQCWLTNYVDGFWSKDTWAWIWIWFISIKACEVTWHLSGMLLCHVSREGRTVICPDSLFTRHPFEIWTKKARKMFSLKEQWDLQKQWPHFCLWTLTFQTTVQMHKITFTRW